MIAMYHSYIFVIYPKGSQGQFVEILKITARQAETSAPQDTRNFDPHALLKRIKDIILAKAVSLPFKTHIAIVEKTDAMPADLARKLAGVNPNTEEYFVMEFPYFEQVTDPAAGGGVASSTAGQVAIFAVGITAVAVIGYVIYRKLTGK